MDKVIKGFETKEGVLRVDYSSLANLPEKFPPEEHTHEGLATEEYVDKAVGEVGGTADSISWENVTDKPEGYPPEEHTHEGMATEEYVNGAVEEKVDKVEGMGLSANSYTDEEKEKLEKVDPEGYVSKSGDTITGDLTIRNPSSRVNANLKLISDNKTYNSGGGDSYSLIQHFTNNDISTCIKNIMPLEDGTFHETQLQLGNGRNFSVAKLLRLWEYEPDGTKACYDVYHEGNKPTVNDISGSVKLETGTYVGTGTCGEDNKTTLTFSGKPYLVFIHDGHWWYEGAFYRPYGNGGRATSIYSSDTNLYVACNNTIWGDNSLTWYNSAIYSTVVANAPHSKFQFNAVDVTYLYIAICL